MIELFLVLGALIGASLLFLVVPIWIISRVVNKNRKDTKEDIQREYCAMQCSIEEGFWDLDTFYDDYNEDEM
jgi:inner membrane protein involved in colicin E2 resistance